MASSKVNVHDSGEEIIVEYDVKRCQRCILSENFPKIKFDEGICNFCRDYDTGGLSNGFLDNGLSMKQLQAIISTKPNRTYDCLALYSGGKDSSYMLHVIKSEIGLNPLAVTLDNGFIADAVLPNMKAVLDHLEIDHILIRPSMRFMKSLYRAAIVNVESHPEQIMYAASGCGSCISVLLSIAAQECIIRNIPLMVGGWTPGQLTDEAMLPGTFLEEICQRHFSKVKLQQPEVSNMIAKYKFIASEYPYLFNPLYKTGYDEKKVYETLHNFGWKKPQDTDSCSSNCRLNGLLVVDHIRKYGFHPYEYELAFHVRTGICSREEALRKITHIEVNYNLINTVLNDLGMK